MSGVTRPGVTPAPAQGAGEGTPVEQPAGTRFEEVLKGRRETQIPRRAGAVPSVPAGAGAGDSAAGASASIEAARDEAAGAPLRRGREEQGEGDLARGPRGRLDEPSVLVASGDPRTPAAARSASPAAAEAPSGAEAAARIEEIARRIVESVELRLGPRGAAELRLELSLGALGHLRVAVSRGEDGRLRLGFESASEKASELVRTRVDELKTALDARGVVLQEVSVKGPEGPTFRLEPGEPAAAAPASESTPVAAPRSGDEAAWRQEGEDREGRRRPDRPEAEDEED